MLERLLQRFVKPQVIYERVNVPVREEVEVFVEVPVDRFVEVKMSPGAGPVDPEHRRLWLMRTVQESRTPEVRAILEALLAMYELDSLEMAMPREEGAKESVIPVRDAGHVVIRGCIELVEGIEQKIHNQQKLIAERDKNA